MRNANPYLKELVEAPNDRFFFDKTVLSRIISDKFQNANLDINTKLIRIERMSCRSTDFEPWFEYSSSLE